ncbi:hypothetical protein GGU10DRAFT_427236 [Lentinula aff. detonsa]|uniref:MOSC domain-containing protein n=1 Tax=Lentinula aff. detonsa TaxID=2804958 RepID=A0AA38NMF5_9AGAR|nr:hypothetical protein GGU10DRAFT_427236 [Lentinula aff. detonsa]
MAFKHVSLGRGKANIIHPLLNDTPVSNNSSLSPMVVSKKPIDLYNNIQISKILVHPIKSCRGISLQSCRYSPEGLEHDRRFCIIEAGSHQVITAREVSKMVMIIPRIKTDERSPHGGVLLISFPEDSGCESFSVPLYPVEEQWERLSDIALWRHEVDGFVCENQSSTGRSPSTILSEYFGRPVHLTVKGNKPRPCDPTVSFPNLKATALYQDGYPLLVLSEESIDVLHEEIRSRVGTQGIADEWSSQEFVIERFRPNIVLRGAGPFAEDNFEEINIGSDDDTEMIGEEQPGILLVSKCVRCLLPNVCPETGVRDKAVPYKVLMKFRIGLDHRNKMKPCVGCNGVPLGNGMIKVGDTVNVRRIIAA